MNTPFWTTEPKILFNSDYINQIYPNSKMTVEEKLNAISRLIIILTFLFFPKCIYNLFIYSFFLHYYIY